MNKSLIEELAYKVLLKTGTPTGSPEWQIEMTKNIIEECLSIVKQHIDNPHGEYDYSYSEEDFASDNRARDIYVAIKHRFGFEE